MKIKKTERHITVRTILTVSFLIVSILLFCFLYSHRTAKDVTAPTLSVSGEIPEYKEGDDMDALLEGVKAEDDVDGDVSDTIRVRSIYYAEGTDEAVVTYVATDKSHNLGIIRRTVKAERKEEPTGEEDTEAGE